MNKCSINTKHLKITQHLGRVGGHSELAQRLTLTLERVSSYKGFVWSTVALKNKLLPCRWYLTWRTRYMVGFFSKTLPKRPFSSRVGMRI